MKQKLKIQRVRPIQELWALEDEAPAICGPNPITYSIRNGIKLSKSYVLFRRRLKLRSKKRTATASRRKIAQVVFHD